MERNKNQFCVISFNLQVFLKLFVEVIPSSSCCRWVIYLTILEYVWMLESLCVSEVGEPLQGYYSNLFITTEHVLVAVRYNWCAVRERELLEHHLIQLNDGTTEKETLLPCCCYVLWIQMLEWAYAKFRVLWIHCAPCNFPVHLRLRLGQENMENLRHWYLHVQLRKIKIQEVVLGDLVQQLKFQSPTSQMNV